MPCFQNYVLFEVILRYYKLIRPASSASIISSTKSIESLGGVFTIKSLTVRPRLYLDNEATKQSLYLPADLPPLALFLVTLRVSVCTLLRFLGGASPGYPC